MSKAPAFQLYAGDFLTDVMDWTDEEVGAHMRLLCWSWVNRRGIPRDTQRLTRISATAVKCWPTIGPKWVEGPDETWISERLERTRADSDAFRSRQKVKSDLAVAARKVKPTRKKKTTSPTGSPNDKPVGISSDIPGGHPPGHPLEGEDEVKSEVLSGKERAPAKPTTHFTGSPFASAEATAAWQGFEAMRKRKGKPMTDRARELITADLINMGEADAITALNNSTRNGWTDVYPPKPHSNGTHAATLKTADPTRSIPDKLT